MRIFVMILKLLGILIVVGVLWVVGESQKTVTTTMADNPSPDGAYRAVVIQDENALSRANPRTKLILYRGSGKAQRALSTNSLPDEDSIGIGNASIEWLCDSNMCATAMNVHCYIVSPTRGIQRISIPLPPAGTK